MFSPIEVLYGCESSVVTGTHIVVHRRGDSINA
jgi:hypothetical protein